MNMLITLPVYFLLQASSLVESVTAAVTIIKYQNFDEYLLDISRPNPNKTTSVNVNKATGPHPVANITTIETSIDILNYFKDVPRRHWSCCMLGKLAGDKGFSCQARFYADRLLYRNVNRAHNKKMNFHGRYRIQGWGMEIMETFSRCVTHQSSQFHQCCYATVTEMRERRRWHRYRVRSNSTATPKVTRS